MKKFLCIPLLLLAGTLFSQENEFRIGDLSAGMHSYQSPNNIPDNAAAYIQNFLTDEDRMALERNGFIKKETTQLGGVRSVVGLWKFKDTSDNEWLIAFSSKTFWRSKTGTAFERFGLIASNENFPDCAVNLGKIMCVNGTDSAWTFDGTSTAVVSGAPIGRLIEPWRTRFAISDITSARSTVRFSEDGLETNWVVGSSATAPFSRLISGTNDGQPVRCLRGSYMDNMVIMRSKDIWSLSGFDQSDDVVRKISDEIGCVSDRTVQELDGSLYWLSNRGVEKRTGNTIELISDPIRDIVDEIVARVISSEKSDTETSAGDWAAGTQSPAVFADTTTVSGDISAKVTNSTLTTRGDWERGSFTINGTTGVVDQMYDFKNSSGTIELKYPDPFNTFRDGTNGTEAIWKSCNAGSCDGTGVSATAGFARIEASPWRNWTGFFTYQDNTGDQKYNYIPDFRPGTTFYMRINGFNETGGNIDFYFTLNNTIYTSLQNPDTPHSTGKFWSYYFKTPATNELILSTGANSNSDTILNSSIRLYCPQDFYLYMTTTTWIVHFGTHTQSGSHTWTSDDGGVTPYMYITETAGPGPTSQFDIDKFGIAHSTRIIFTSPVIDSSVLETHWDVFSSSISGHGTVTFETQSSSDGVTWGTAISVSTGSKPTSPTNRYIRTIAKMRQTSASGTPVSIHSQNITGYSSGTFQSQTIDTGGTPTSWGQFQVLETDVDNKISYFFNASTSSTYFNPSSWTAIGHQDVPTNGLNQYVAIKASFTITNATNTATLHSFTINWIDGSSNPLSSTIWDRRYILSYSTTNDSPDTAIVWQKNSSWTLFNGVNAASWAEWANDTYFGNSNNTGYVYQFDSGTNDDGAAIESVINFKSYDATTPSRDKEFRNLYTSFLGNTAHSGSFSASYQLDRDGNSYSLGSALLNEGTGQKAVKFPFPISNSVRGREIQYVIEKTGTANRLRLYDLVTVYEVKESP